MLVTLASMWGHGWDQREESLDSYLWVKCPGVAVLGRVSGVLLSWLGSDAQKRC